MDDMDCLGSKILSNVDNQLKNDPEIDEYDILPILASTRNRNPVHVVEHKMAVESWGAKLMFCTAAKDIKRWRHDCKRLLATETDWLSSRTRCVLLICPDHATAWNIRKEMIINDQLKIADDLQLCQLILTKHPKSSEVFAQRRWLISSLLHKSSLTQTSSIDVKSGDEGQLTSEYASVLRTRTANPAVDKHHHQFESRSQQLDFCVGPIKPDALSNVVLSCGDLKSTSHHESDPSKRVSHSCEWHCLVQNELSVCHSAADRYPSNYNAWSHRTWVLQHVACCPAQTIHSELKSTESFVWSHVSDHSGFQYRQFLLEMLACKLSDDTLCLLDRELLLTRDLITSYPEHEAIWNHRRYVLHSLIRQKDFSAKDAAVVGSDKDINSDDGMHVSKRTRLEYADSGALVESEHNWCRSILGNCVIDGWQGVLVKNHVRWLNQVVQDISQT